MVSLAEPFFKEDYKGTFVLLEPITEGLRRRIETLAVPWKINVLFRINTKTNTNVINLFTDN